LIETTTATGPCRTNARPSVIAVAPLVNGASLTIATRFLPNGKRLPGRCGLLTGTGLPPTGNARPNGTGSRSKVNARPWTDAIMNTCCLYTTSSCADRRGPLTSVAVLENAGMSNVIS
jgi:hypothetical protein